MNLEQHQVAANPQTKITNLGYEPGYYITLHQKTIYSGLSKSNFKDHCGDVVITQCLGKIAEINEYSASDKML